MKASPDLQQRADAPVDVGITFGRFGDSRQKLEEGAFAGAVAPDHAHDFSRLYRKVNILDSPDSRVPPLPISISPIGFGPKTAQRLMYQLRKRLPNSSVSGYGASNTVLL